MATLEEFLRTGHLGPVILGMTPTAVMDAVGEPDDISKKANPLYLKFGLIQLTFWKDSGARIPQLLEIFVPCGSAFESLPQALAFADWIWTAPPDAGQFRDFALRIGCPPVHRSEGESGRQLTFASDVTAIFDSGGLRSLRLVQRLSKQSTHLPLSDEREPTEGQIRGMLDEAEKTVQIGAHRAALLIAWAGLEATLRRLAIREGLQGKIGVQPSILLRELFAAGLLSPKEHGNLEELRQLRMASAHGLAPVEVRPGDIPRITGIANRLLAGEEKSIGNFSNGIASATPESNANIAFST